MSRLASCLIALALLAGCASQSTISEPPADLQHAKPAGASGAY